MLFEFPKFTLRYQNVQKKVQQELDDVLGTERLPSLNDKANLPYTEVIMIP